MKIKLLAYASVFVACQLPFLMPAVAAEGLPGATVNSGDMDTPGRERAGSRREPPPEGRPAAREQCQADPEKCRAEMRARREQWCKDNAEKCREMKARVEQRREQCRADPAKCRAEMQARQQERFKRADTDGNNALSREEAGKSARALARHFDRIDANKDGQITLEEIQAARKARGGASKAKPVNTTG